MEIDAVTRSYQRWAPVYDYSFGAVSRLARARAVRHVNSRQGTVLEVGVGTGLSLAQYAPHLQVTGIDFSDAMLDKARERVAEKNLSNVSELRQMDARFLDFPDNHFDTVTAMFIVSVVPEPERVMAEMARVCKPGGEVVILNHFARQTGVMARLARLFSRFENTLGWQSNFAMARITGESSLHLAEKTAYAPFGLFTFLRLQRQ